MSFEYPRDTLFKCTKCAICCSDTEIRVRHILLLKKEAQRISKITSNPIEEFAVRIKGRDPYAYEMKKTKQGKCTFLQEKDCSVYLSRPLICKFYPFQLRKTRNGKYGFFATEECPGIGKGPRLGRSYFKSLFHQACHQIEEKPTQSCRRFADETS